MTEAQVRERVRELCPGDENKSLRNRLYKREGFLKSSPTDDQIMLAATEEMDQDSGEPPAVKIPVKEGVVLDEGQAFQEAMALDLPPKPMVVNTPEDYEIASRIFSQIKKVVAALEKERKELKEPILESGRRLDAKYNAMKAQAETGLPLVELPMIAFKTRERDELRKQEEERQRILRAEQAKALQEVSKAKARLEAAHQAEESEDPFLAALAAEDVAEAQADTRNALVALATVPQRVVVPDAVAPIVASGSRTSYPWVFEITDENKVDRSLCSPDPVKIRARIKMLKEELDGDIMRIGDGMFPGLKIMEEIKLSGR